MSDLRSRVIRLAHARPDLRPALLPLLKESASRVAGKPHKWLLDNPEANRLFNQILGQARKTDWEPYMVKAALKILEGVESQSQIPHIGRHYGIDGYLIQEMYEEKSNPFGDRKAPMLNLMLEDPRLKGMIHKYVEAAEKTGVSAVDAADWLDQTAWDILARPSNTKIFNSIDDDHPAVYKAIKEIEENDEEYQGMLSEESWAESRWHDSRDRY
jgi:hypothetical protein